MADYYIFNDPNSPIEYSTVIVNNIPFASYDYDFGAVVNDNDFIGIKANGSICNGGICAVQKAVSIPGFVSTSIRTTDGTDTLTVSTEQTNGAQNDDKFITLQFSIAPNTYSQKVVSSAPPSGGGLYTVVTPVLIHNTFDDTYRFITNLLSAQSDTSQDLNVNVNPTGFSTATYKRTVAISGFVAAGNARIGQLLGEGVITDPYAPEGGPSEPGGGNGTFDGTSDANPIPSDPTISATDTGFMTAFATNLAGIQSVAASLWTDLFDAIKPGGTLEGTVEALKSLVNSPYDAILGCHIIPVTVPVGTSKNVKLYGVLPSSVSLPVASTQWVSKDCGSLTIAKFDDSYLDYAPYSKVTSMYLPFIGVVSVDIDIIMNTTVGVYYKIDIISGQCVAFITVDGRVEFQYQGQCAVPLPVTSVDWSTTVSAGLGLIGSVGSIAGSAVGGALGGGGAAGALAGAVKGTIGEAGSIAQNVMNSKPDIKSGSGVGGAAALMGCKKPYLIIERPRKSTPGIGNKYQNHWTGYPANIAARIGSLKGYTEVSRVFINSTTATAEEKQEIEKLLNEGVYL